MIAAEGEQKASRALREASNTIAESSSALQLRYLQVRRISFLTFHQQFSDLEFYISREELHDNISNTFRHNVQLYEVGDRSNRRDLYQYNSFLGNRKIDNTSDSGPCWDDYFVIFRGQNFCLTVKTVIKVIKNE